MRHQISCLFFGLTALTCSAEVVGYSSTTPGVDPQVVTYGTIDVVSGVVTPLGTVPGVFNDFVWDASAGVLYSYYGSNNELFSIDVVSGRATSLGIVPINAGSFVELLVEPETGNLLVIDSINFELTGIWRIDPATAQGEFVGTIEGVEVISIATNPLTNEMVFSGFHDGGYVHGTLDLEAGSFTVLSDPINDFIVTNYAFTPDGVLYGSSTATPADVISVYDPTTGERLSDIQLSETFPFDAVDLFAFPQVIPAPGAPGLLALGVLALARRRRKSAPAS